MSAASVTDRFVHAGLDEFAPRDDAEFLFLGLTLAVGALFRDHLVTRGHFARR